jgi:DNA-binding GntR family transcriptional regulator
MLPQGPPELRRSWLLQALREAIATGDLRPGDRLVERDISARTGLSRGPVREAILVLEQEGLVVSESYRGAQVASVSAEEVENMLVPIRAVLEKFAFRHAAGRLTEDDHAELSRMVDQMHAAANDSDLRTVVDADMQFHEYVIARCGWQHCERSWRSIAARVRAYFWADASQHRSLHDVAEQHQVLLDALRGGNEKALMRAVVKHVNDRPGFGASGTAPRKSATR